MELLLNKEIKVLGFIWLCGIFFMELMSQAGGLQAINEGSLKNPMEHPEVAPWSHWGPFGLRLLRRPRC